MHKATNLVFDNLTKQLAIHIKVHLDQKFHFYEFGWECAAYWWMLQKYFCFPIFEK